MIHHKRFLITLYGLVLLWITLSSASAATFYVATSGADTPTCGTSIAPCKTIGQGLDVMGGGDTLIIRNGTYPEGNLRPPSGSQSSPTTVKAESGATVLIRPNNIGVDIIIGITSSGHDIVFDSLIVDGGDSSGSTAVASRLTAFPLDSDANSTDASPNVGGTRITLLNMEVRRSRRSCITMNGTFYTMRGSYIHHCGSDTNLDHGWYATLRNSLIENNTWEANWWYQFQNYTSSGNFAVTDNVYRGNFFTGSQGGITISSGSARIQFYNNVSYNDATNTNGSAACINGPGPNGVAYNNTCWTNLGSRGNWIINAGTNTSPGARVGNNIVCGPWGSADNPDATYFTNYIGCPAFASTNPSAPNFLRLTAGSAAIDYGSCAQATLNTGGVVTIDADNVSRPQPTGGACDAGAYEFVSGGTSAATATLSASPTTITSGQTSTLTWSSTNATSCTGTGFSTGSATSGSIPVSPTATTTYSVTCTGAGGASSPATATVTVNTAATVGTFYVDVVNGSDANTCTEAKVQSTPKQTLANTLPCILGGSTIFLRAGVYPEAVNSTVQTIPGGSSWATPTRIAAFNNEGVTFRPGGGGYVMNFESASNAYLEVSGITLDGGGTSQRTFRVAGPAHHIRLLGSISTATVASAIVSINSDNNEFVSNTVLNAGQNGIYIDGTSNGTLVDGNTITGQGERGIYVSSGSTATTVRNNYVHDPVGTSTFPCMVFDASGATPILAINNVIASCPSGAVVIGAGSPAGLKLYNSTIYNSSPGVTIAAGVSGAQIANTLIASSATPISNSGTGTVFVTNLCPAAGTGCSVVGPPGFVDATAGNFQLLSSSLAVNAGTTLPEVPVDILGATRPTGSSTDIGAYEFVGTTVPGPGRTQSWPALHYFRR